MNELPTFGSKNGMLLSCGYQLSRQQLSNEPRPRHAQAAEGVSLVIAKLNKG